MGKIRHLTVYTDRVKTSKKILVYSDLHLGFKRGIDVQAILKYKELNPSKYDCILIPGDIVHCLHAVRDEKTKLKVFVFLEKLTGETPVYYVLGNHDQYFRRHFEGFDADYSQELVQELRHLENFKWLKNGEKVILDGLEIKGMNNSVDYYLKDRETNEAFLNDCFKVRDNVAFSEGAYSILLVHDPKAIYRLKREFLVDAEEHTDLVVSGHMHNAMVPNFLQGILKGRGFISPDYTVWPEYAYGVRQEGETLFLVNGAINSFMEQELINKIYGFNCTTLTIAPQEKEKKLVYSYK